MESDEDDDYEHSWPKQGPFRFVRDIIAGNISPSRTKNAFSHHRQETKAHRVLSPVRCRVPAQIIQRRPEISPKRPPLRPARERHPEVSRVSGNRTASPTRGTHAVTSAEMDESFENLNIPGHRTTFSTSRSREPTQYPSPHSSSPEKVAASADVFKVPQVPEVAAAAKGNTVNLSSWFPVISERHKLHVEGLSPDMKSPDKRLESWRSRNILSVKNPRLLVTKSRMVSLEGDMDTDEALKRKVPGWVIDEFQSGFPAYWKILRNIWKKCNMDQDAQDRGSVCSFCSSSFSRSDVESVSVQSLVIEGESSSKENRPRRTSLESNVSDRVLRQRKPRSKDDQPLAEMSSTSNTTGAPHDRQSDKETTKRTKKTLGDSWVDSRKSRSKKKPEQEMSPKITQKEVTTDDETDRPRQSSSRRNKESTDEPTSKNRTSKRTKSRADHETTAHGVKLPNSLSDNNDEPTLRKKKLSPPKKQEKARKTQREISRITTQRKRVTHMEPDESHDNASISDDEMDSSSVRRFSQRTKARAETTHSRAVVRSLSSSSSDVTTEEEESVKPTKKKKRSPPKKSGNVTRKTKPDISRKKAQRKKATDGKTVGRRRDEESLNDEVNPSLKRQSSKRPTNVRTKVRNVPSSPTDDDLTTEEEDVEPAKKMKRSPPSKKREVAKKTKNAKKPNRITSREARETAALISSQATYLSGDDYFQPSLKSKAKQPASQGEATAADIAKKLQSDSDQEETYSVWSAKTPIASYLGIETPAPESVSHSQLPQPKGRVDRYIARKRNERGMAKHLTVTLPRLDNKVAPKSRREVELESNALVRPISQYLRSQSEEEDSSDEMTEFYGPNNDDHQSMINEPAGIRSLSDNLSLRN